MSGQHGTYAAYKRGCRCEPCAEYQRARVARSRAQRLAEGRINHGNPGWDDGCRCAVCTRAHKSRFAEYYQERKEAMTGKVSIHAMSNPMLRRMRAQLVTAIRNAQKRVERIDATLKERGQWLDAPIEPGPDRVTRTGRPSTVRHGTDSGYYYHLRHWNTTPCADCRRAHRSAENDRKRRRDEAA